MTMWRVGWVNVAATVLVTSFMAGYMSFGILGPAASGPFLVAMTMFASPLAWGILAGYRARDWGAIVVPVIGLVVAIPFGALLGGAGLNTAFGGGVGMLAILCPILLVSFVATFGVRVLRGFVPVDDPTALKWRNLSPPSRASGVIAWMMARPWSIALVAALLHGCVIAVTLVEGPPVANAFFVATRPLVFSGIIALGGFTAYAAKDWRGFGWAFLAGTALNSALLMGVAAAASTLSFSTVWYKVPFGIVGAIVSLQLVPFSFWQSFVTGATAMGLVQWGLRWFRRRRERDTVAPSLVDGV